MTNNLTVVAMSGGVDSSVSAYLLAKDKVPSIGISMQVWDYRNNGGCRSKATCCAPDDFTDARKVAAKIGIPYYVFDFEKTFRKEVIDKFVETYQRGETPNPCVDCNNKVKFRELRDRAKALGCSGVATGHYAQIKKDALGYHLLRGKDSEKDQSYFLYGISQKELSETIFPVGHLTKSEVRQIAREAGLVTAEKSESQDICFVSDTAADFVARIGGLKPKGLIVTKSGEIVGQHNGIHRYTIGQRRGIGVGGHHSPWYVVEINNLTNTVVVGEKSDLERESFLVDEISFATPDLSILNADEFIALVQVRHRHEGVKVKVKKIGSKKAEVLFLEDWTTISPGQAAVFYSLDNMTVLGGGTICQTNQSSQSIMEAA